MVVKTISRGPVWIEVDLSAFEHNLGQIRQLVGSKAQVLAVVKANAYGHGLLPVARALVAAGADQLGVAHAVEGITLRRNELRQKILVLGQILPDEVPGVVENGLIPAVGDAAIAEALSQEGLRRQHQVDVHLKVDTGMGRYGVWHEEALELARHLATLPGIKLQGIFSHLAMAGQSAEATTAQINRFSRLLEKMPQAGLEAGIRHLANSVGLVRFPASRLDLVRTGLLLYGISPIREGRLPLELKAPLTLKAQVRFLKTLPAGQSVSYGGTFKALRPTRVATIPIGYAHGYPRSLSNRACLLIQGRRAPVVGKITMEDLMADVTDIPEVRIGDEVVLIGSQGQERITTGELARHARTIPYEILAGLTPRIPRFYE